MELFGSFAFFGGALFGGLGLLLYRTLGLPWRLGYRHLIGALCLAVWLAGFWTRPYQPLGLLAVASAALWAMRRGHLPTWAAVLLTMALLLLLKCGITTMTGMLGLSFATFRAVDVLLFAPRNERISPLDYCNYLFFPLTLLAGPMYRWRNFQADLKRGYEGVTLETWLAGLELLIFGVIQKFGVAEAIWRYGLNTLDAHDYSLTGVALNASLYSFYLFFDFAGYSSMAIGVGMLFGFTLPVNFRNPLASANPQDFWRRWHISLSEWLRDVVFMPIYKALSKTAFFGRHRLAAQNIGILATLLAMGVWNGLALHYVVSGLMFGAYSVGHNLLVQHARTRPALQAFLARRPVQWAGRALTLILAALALYVFSGRSPI
ncbi:protein involved in the transfer of D-alanine into teichoic acids [Bordetella pertussis]|uniref:MBOAT family O-acyltransferase n=1 Tax=Bordetella pertussis TaxID=520 RepID=UPI0005E861D5|nr:MBOAT family O-acyltransferase [Bordetella pertussis]CFB55018.1 protein involved in the transfer of D-alanine into teichoic acids [Bordetella pertussis]CFM12302.1 protein involved in the transfer of D-alanine into teichoic acids [Bordetella pertussis]CFN50421.1 protein involved in the transfer of D-alanine into teichoic acids [Bordetella pertussis]CFN50565.1 protein involved in the transfer of D-alanine into teichoic acids [Bordetella pertussis]CFP69799.1 protein involved in the transfer of